MVSKVYPLNPQSIALYRQSSEPVNHKSVKETSAFQDNKLYEDKVELAPKPRLAYDSEEYISSINPKEVAKAILEKVFL